MPTKLKNSRHPGGRPEKLNKEKYIQITCVLRRDTVKRLKAGAGGAGRHFGGFLQDHLDRYPPPTRKEYLEQLAWEGSITQSVIEAIQPKPRKTRERKTAKN